MKSLSGHSIRFWRAGRWSFSPIAWPILDGIRSRQPVLARTAMDRYFEAQRERFEQDETLRSLNLASPKLVTIVSDMVRQFRD